MKQFVCIFFLVLFSQCSKGYQEELVGSWQLAYISPISIFKPYKDTSSTPTIVIYKFDKTNFYINNQFLSTYTNDEYKNLYIEIKEEDYNKVKSSKWTSSAYDVADQTSKYSIIGDTLTMYFVGTQMAKLCKLY